MVGDVRKRLMVDERSRTPGGVICPIATPLDPLERLSAKVLRDHVEALLQDVDGIFALGSSGELPWLSPEVATHAARAIIDQVAGRVPVYLGVGDTSTQRTLARIDEMSALGAGYLVVAPPFYYPIGPQGLHQHYTTIADRSPLPIVVYNIPQNTGAAVPPAVVHDLADHPNILGIKDSAGDPFAFGSYLRAASGREFAVMQGREQLMAMSYWQGAVGVISALANFAPRLLQRVQHLILSGGTTSDVLAAQEQVTDLACVFDHGYWVSALKAALATCGFEVGDPARPLEPCTDQQRTAITAILARHRAGLTFHQEAPLHVS
jgi:4-hydroxy-tetrahydrodipicolinate synthase